MFRSILTALIGALIPLTSEAAFTLTGNPANDYGWVQSGYSLANGNYVRGTGNHSYEIYRFQTRIVAGDNPVAGWSAGDQVIGLGGRYYPTIPPGVVGWPSYTGPIQTAGLANTRVVAKFGADTPPGVGGNNFTASTTAPNVSTGALGSFSSGNGGLGSIQVSIASGRFTSANAGSLITPSIIGATDNVAQYDGLFAPVPGHGSQGLDLFDPLTSTFPSARYIYTVDGSGNLATWEVLINATMARNYPGALSALVPTGGQNWIMTVQNGGSGFTDGLVKTDPFVDAPAPPAILLAAFGGMSLLALRRRMK